MGVALILVALIAYQASCSHVVELSADELLKIAHGNTEDPWFIKFYGPNCGFCKSMAPAWEDLADEIESEGLDIKIGAFNVHEDHVGFEGVRDLFPGPLPGLHFFPPQDKKFYEFPNPRFAVGHEGFMEFALSGWEEVDGVFRKPEYFYQEETDIVNIPGEDFDKVLTKSTDPLFVMFFGPKCGWCKAMMPLWQRYAREVKEQGLPLVVARMDGFSNLNIVDRYTARPWPSLVYLTEGKYYRMDTDDVREIKETQELHDWINDKEYLELDDEHWGEDEGYAKYLRMQQAKEKSRNRRKQREAGEL